jgi:hypothetical protein
MSPEFDTRVKLAIYRATAETGRPPTLDEVAGELGIGAADVEQAWGRLAKSRLLVLGPDGRTIRMAPPFSGVPTQHRVVAGGVDYFANCAWDALGIPAALHRPAEVISRCEQSRETLRLRVGHEGPEPSAWLFHCAVPAAKWWEDIVFT